MAFLFDRWPLGRDLCLVGNTFPLTTVLITCSRDLTMGCPSSSSVVKYVNVV
jgi:hypothetical protein